jgi:putative transposase
MSSFTSLSYHVIFSTKHRHPSITSDFRTRLYEYLAGVIRDRKGRAIEIGGVADHVHILAYFSPSTSVSDMIRDIKSISSGWVNDQRFLRGRFEWQIGFAAFSVSYSVIETVRKYILDQESHHQVKTFEDEYIAFLERHGIEFDRRYLFEKEFAG